MTSSLSDSSVVVIGGGSGIGRETALAFAALNARVVVVGRDRGRLERVQRAAERPIEIRAGDATDAAAIAALLRETQPDVIVLSAGTHARLAPVSEHSWESFSEPWNQDVRMAFTVGQAALKLPLRAGSSVIVVSSGAGLGGSPLSGGYAGAKRMQMFLATYLQQIADAERLGIRFLALVPKQLVAGTEIAESAGRAYAARAGITLEKFMERFGAPLTPGAVADAIVSVARGEVGQGATVLGVTGKGTEVL